MFIVGLTGGLATGKSTVLKIFKESSIPVIDADQIAREIVEPGRKCWKLIRAEFGDQILGKDQQIDRAILGALIFDDPEKRRKLNAITHPQIQKTLAQVAITRFMEGHAFIVMELPLLFETGRMMSFMHKIITVVCNDDQQLERLCQRDYFPPDIAKKRIDCQMPLEEKVANSQFVIDNSGSFHETRKQTDNIIKVLKTSKFHWFIRGGLLALIIGIPSLIGFLYYYFYLSNTKNV